MLSNSPSLFIIPGGTPGGCGFFISAQSLSLAGIFSVKHVPKMQLRASLAQEKLEKEKNEELIQAKLQFFANISHEFRTPLTLIIAQIEALLQVNTLSPFSAQSPDKNLQKHIPVQRADLRATGFPEDGTWETASKRLPNGPHPLLETNSSRFHRPSELTEYTVHIPYRNRKLVVLVRWTTIEESPHQSTFQCL